MNDLRCRTRDADNENPSPQTADRDQSIEKALKFARPLIVRIYIVGSFVLIRSRRVVYNSYVSKATDLFGMSRTRSGRSHDRCK